MENPTKKHAVCPPPESAQKARFQAAEAPMRRGGPGPGHGPGPRGAMMGRVKLKNTRGTIFRLLGYLKYVKLEIIGALLALILSTACTLITPIISGNLIDLLNETCGIVPALAAAGAFGAYAVTALGTQAILRRNNGQTGALTLGSVAFRGLTVSLLATAATAGVTGAAAWTADSAIAELIRLIGLMALLYITSSLLSLAQQLLLVRVAQQTVRVLRKDLFDHLQTLPLRFFDSHPHGELMSRLSNDVDNVSNMLSSSITQVMSSAITIVISLSMMLYLSWVLTLVSLITIPISMLLMKAVTSRSGKLFKAQQACLGQLNGIVEETVTGARVVKVFTREEAVIEDFEAANQALTEAGTKATILSRVIGPMMNMINNIGFALMAGIGGALVLSGNVGSVGMIQSFLQYQRQFSRPFNEIANQVSVVQSALAGAERVFDVIDESPEPADAPDAVPLPAPKGDVEFRDVVFGYTPKKKILDGVSFHARPGETVALVGPTGAGKTTIVNLLMRFYDIQSGQILVDGHDLTDIRRQDLRSSMGMVLQDVYLFAGTVRENIAYGKPDATDEEIIAAAKLANCHGFISRLPDGYDTVLAEDGGNISQGQRQLLSIARAVLANPAVLILDEATSSVDTRTEMKIQSAMLKLMEGRTSFVIAHRLSTIRTADQILVIKDGRIFERGTHEELIAKNGFYASLLASQYRGQAI